MEHHLLAPWAFGQAAWLWRAHQFWRAGTWLPLVPLLLFRNRFVCREEIALKGTLHSQFCSAQSLKLETSSTVKSCQTSSDSLYASKVSSAVERWSGIKIIILKCL